MNKKFVKFEYKVVSKINDDDDISEVEDEFILNIEHDEEILS